jgi:hypothetical protein
LSLLEANCVEKKTKSDFFYQELCTLCLATPKKKIKDAEKCRRRSEERETVEEKLWKCDEWLRGDVGGVLT